MKASECGAAARPGPAAARAQVNAGQLKPEPGLPFTNYNGVPIPSPDTRPDLAKPVIYWTPVIAGNLTFYNGELFPQWKGSALVSGLSTQSLNRITFDGKGGASPAERWRWVTAFATWKSVRTARCGCSRTSIPAGCSA